MKAKANRRKGASQKRHNRNWKPIALLIGGVLLLGVGVVAYVSATPTVRAALDYRPEDVAHEQPVLAIHEMGEGAPIPFLPRNQAQPRIQVPEKYYNFGVVGAQDVVEREFIIRNTGEAPLTISRAYTTCGCTTAEISATVIPPGQVATVKLIFDAGYHDAAGQTVRRGLIIENNDLSFSQAEIWIQASVRSN